MAKQNTESKRLLSYVIAEWACSLKYENLSPEAIQAAKLFWFDSIGLRAHAKFMLPASPDSPAESSSRRRLAHSTIRVRRLINTIRPK